MLRRALFAGDVGVLAIGLSSVETLAQTAAQRSWDGFNVSLGGGASKADSELAVGTSNTDRLDVPIFAFPFFGVLSLIGEAAGQSKLSDDEWQGFGTLQAGYDQRFGSFVIGGFGSFDFYPGQSKDSATNGIDGSLTIQFDPFIGPTLTSPPIPIPGYASATSSLELESTWSVGGRAGYLVTPNTLLYALAGYTEAKYDGQIDLTYFTGAQPLSLRVPDELRGYFVGAGGEVNITDNVALRLEYRYANYQGEAASTGTSDGFTFLGINYAQTANLRADLDAEIHSVRGAVVLQLGQP